MADHFKPRAHSCVTSDSFPLKLFPFASFRPSPFPPLLCRQAGPLPTRYPPRFPSLTSPLIPSCSLNPGCEMNTYQPELTHAVTSLRSLLPAPTACSSYPIQWFLGVLKVPFTGQQDLHLDGFIRVDILCPLRTIFSPVSSTEIVFTDLVTRLPAIGSRGWGLRLVWFKAGEAPARRSVRRSVGCGDATARFLSPTPIL